MKGKLLPLPSIMQEILQLNSFQVCCCGCHFFCQFLVVFQGRQGGATCWDVTYLACRPLTLLGCVPSLLSCDSSAVQASLRLRSGIVMLCPQCLSDCHAHLWLQDSHQITATRDGAAMSSCANSASLRQSWLPCCADLVARESLPHVSGRLNNLPSSAVSM
jgi:hypothetical protein